MNNTEKLGSITHTLRRVGTTWTEAPGRDREEFMSSVRRGLGRPGGRDGGALAVSGDAYGVSVNLTALTAIDKLLGLPPLTIGVPPQPRAQFTNQTTNTGPITTALLNVNLPTVLSVSVLPAGKVPV